MEKSNENMDFLQSAQWREFQEKVGRKTYFIEKEGFSASMIEHVLPIVGKYFYVPRGPVIDVKGQRSKVKGFLSELISLAKKENAGWIRIEPENLEAFEMIEEVVKEKIVKAPHDMQPKEVFVIDIEKPAEQLLSEMKTKTRYNIGIAQKKGVKIYSCDKKSMECMRVELDFFRLTKEMAARQGITSHPEEYYRKMVESFPSDMLKIYAAEYDGPASTRGDDHSSTRGGKIIATNLILFYGNTATYLHGASGNLNRNLMAPFALQWQAILDAKEKGCKCYDFGGVKTKPYHGANKWEGITTFKTGFSMKTKPLEFPGSYDIIINPRMYGVYRGLQRAKSMLHKFR